MPDAYLLFSTHHWVWLDLTYSGVLKIEVEVKEIY